MPDTRPIGAPGGLPVAVDALWRSHCLFWRDGLSLGMLCAQWIEALNCAGHGCHCQWLSVGTGTLIRVQSSCNGRLSMGGCRRPSHCLGCCCISVTRSHSDGLCISEQRLAPVGLWLYEGLRYIGLLTQLILLVLAAGDSWQLRPATQFDVCVVRSVRWPPTLQCWQTFKSW